MWKSKGGRSRMPTPGPHLTALRSTLRLRRHLYNVCLCVVVAFVLWMRMASGTLSSRNGLFVGCYIHTNTHTRASEWVSLTWRVWRALRLRCGTRVCAIKLVTVIQLWSVTTNMIKITRKRLKATQTYVTSWIELSWVYVELQRIAHGKWRQCV